MKKLLTLCLALAMTVSVGAIALTAFGAPVAKAADETTTEKPETLTVKATEAYAYATETPETHNAFTADPTSGTMKRLKTKYGFTLFSDKVLTAPNVYYKFASAVNASDYAFMTFSALYYAGKVPKAYATAVKSLDGSSSASVGIFGRQNDSNAPQLLKVSVATSGIKNADGKVEGFVMTAPVAQLTGMNWFMITDFTFTDKAPATIDYEKSTELQQDLFEGLQIWKDNELRNRRFDVSGNLRTAIRFVTPLPVESVDYFDFKALIWNGRREGLPFNVYSLNGDKIHQSVYVFNYAAIEDPKAYEGQLDMRVAAKGLENENGLVEGFEFEILNIEKGSHLVFSDIVAAKEHSQSVVVDEQHSTSSNKWGFMNFNWSPITAWNDAGLLYGGRDLENGTLTVKLKYPVDVAKVKSIDFDAIVWNNPSEKHLRISRLDGTPVEVIKVVCGHEAALAEEDLGVKVNAELLANEFGLCEGFIMQVVEDNALGHLQFTKPVAGLTQKSYKATITFGNGTKEEIVYTASDRAAKLADAKAKLGTNDAQYTFSDDLPEELPFEEGKAYTETRTVNEYDVVIGEAEAVKVAYGAKLEKPEDPTKEPTADTVYTFDGWYNGDNKWNFETDTVTGNVTLVAKFNETVRKYDVVIGEAAAIKVAYGAKLEKPEDPTKETTASTIYAFDGWYNGDSKWNFETDTVTGNVTLVAKFNETVRTYTVTVTFAGLEKEQVTLTREYGAKVNFDEYAESGYKMTAKKGEEAITELTVTENSDIVITYEKEKSKSGKGCGGSAGGIGVAMAALGLVAVALKKKR